MIVDRAELARAPAPSSNWGSTIRLGYLIVGATFIGLGGWSSIARLDAAVIAQGAVAPQSNRKTVQHLEGGIVSEIAVHDGDIVKEGQLLMRLDRTQSAAADLSLRNQDIIARCHEARLLAQRDKLEKVKFPEEIVALSADPVIASAIADNQNQFASRRKSFVNGAEVLDKQLSQAAKDVEQAQSDHDTSALQLKSVEEELAPLEVLLVKGLVPVTRVTTVQRQKQALEGAIAKSAIDLARAKDKISEIEARRKQWDEDYGQEAANSLLDVRKSMNDVSQKMVVTGDALRRVDILAPVGGTVQQLRFFTVGGVVRSGEPIMDIMPAADTLVVRSQVLPIDIDRIHSDMPAEIRFPQFASVRDLNVHGIVKYVSQDSIQDPATHQSYYAIEVSVDRSNIPTDINEKLMSGMMTTVVVPTGRRTVLGYLVGPLMSRLSMSMRER
jgi:S-layer protein transport system membrane fusion protein